jgi:thymidylate synthase
VKQYLDLIRHVLSEGTRKENRTGVDTLSTFGYYYEHDMQDGFPLLTTKRMSWKNIVIELLWFLSGSNKADFLQRHGCNFWAPWTDDHQVVSNCYGPAWRHFPVHQSVCGEFGGPSTDELGFNDQIRWLVEELKRNPLSRRMVVSAWAPGIAQTAKLPPCHCMFILNVQNEEDPNVQRMNQRLCLHMTQRSCDTALGVPYNLASYALLLSLLSRFSGIKPGIFGHTLVDAHIYTGKPDGTMHEYDHIPGLEEQCSRQPKALPTLTIDDSIRDLEDVECLLAPEVTTEQIMSLFRLEGYEPYPNIQFKVAV